MTVWIGFCKIYEANKKHIGKHDLSDKAFQKIVAFVAWNFIRLESLHCKTKNVFQFGAKGWHESRVRICMEYCGSSTVASVLHGSLHLLTKPVTLELELELIKRHWFLFRRWRQDGRGVGITNNNSLHHAWHSTLWSAIPDKGVTQTLEWK